MAGVPSRVLVIAIILILRLTVRPVVIIIDPSSHPEGFPLVGEVETGQPCQWRECGCRRLCRALLPAQGPAACSRNTSVSTVDKSQFMLNLQQAAPCWTALSRLAFEVRLQDPSVARHGEHAICP